MRKKKILITGAGGFLGRNLFTHISDTHVDQPWQLEAHTREKCDLMDGPAAIKYIESRSPDFVIHCAAACGGLLANKDAPGDMLANNLAMTANVLMACVDSSVERVTLIGTPCSYAVSASLPLREMYLGEHLNLGNATGAYGIAKWAGWQMAKAYQIQYGLRFNYLVPGNMYGPRDNFNVSSGHVVASMIRKFSENNQEVSLIGPNTDTRDFVYVGDVCRAISTAVDLETHGHPINISSGSETSIGDLADHVRDLTGSQARIIWEERNISRHPRRWMDIDRAHSLLSWQPTTDLRKGLQQTINWYRRHYPAK